MPALRHRRQGLASEPVWLYRQLVRDSQNRSESYLKAIAVASAIVLAGCGAVTSIDAPSEIRRASLSVARSIEYHYATCIPRESRRGLVINARVGEATAENPRVLGDVEFLVSVGADAKLQHIEVSHPRRKLELDGAFSDIVDQQRYLLVSEACSTFDLPPLAFENRREFWLSLTAISGHEGIRQAVRTHLERCVPIEKFSAVTELGSVDIFLRLDDGGNIREAHVIKPSDADTSERFLLAAESARNAIVTANCSPIDLPIDLYDDWKDILIALR